MYNYIIIDDDAPIRERIIEMISSSDLDLHCCGQAADGIKAREIFENKHPQIVIMDINIPYVNGIDTAKIMLDEDPDVNVIIITGYGTLDAAQTAIHAGVIDFLSKPVNQDDLYKSLHKIINNLHIKNEQAVERLRMRNLLKKSVPLLKSRYLFSLMQNDSDTINPDECSKTLQELGITQEYSEICVCVVITINENRTPDEQISMQSILEEELETRFSVSNIHTIFLYDSMQRIIIIAFSDYKQLGNSIEQKLSQIRDKMRYIHSMDFRASIGSVIYDFSRLNTSYSDALRALDYWNVMGSNNIVNCSTVKYINSSEVRLPSISYSEIMDGLISEDSGDILNILNEYLDNIAYMPQSSIQIVRQKAVELVALISSGTGDIYTSKNGLGMLSPDMYAKLLSAQNVPDIKAIVTDVAQSAIKLIHDERDNSKLRALTGAKQYIQKNYSKPDINLTQVADSVNLSSGYTSQLFKKYENCSFTEYLNKVRIERAKQLLMTTHMRVYEVSDAVGYQNSKYFFQVFKEITGMRPREFYEASISNNESR